MGTPTETFVGKHVADLLGADGFEQIAKPYYDGASRERKSITRPWFNLSLGQRYLAVT